MAGIQEIKNLFTVPGILLYSLFFQGLGSGQFSPTVIVSHVSEKLQTVKEHENVECNDSNESLSG